MKKSIHEVNIIIIFAVVTAVLVIGLGINSVYQIKKMHALTQNLYKHSLKVSSATLNIKLELSNIHRIMDKIVVNEPKEKRESLIQAVQESGNKINKYFEIIKNNVIGLKAKETAETTQLLFKQATTIHNQFIALLKENRLKEATELKHLNNHKYFLILESFTTKLDKYSSKIATKYHAESLVVYDRFRVISIILTVMFLLVFSILTFYTYTRIKHHTNALEKSEARLQELTQKYELAISGTKDGLWDWNVEEGTVYFAPFWKEMLGYKDEELPNEFSSWEDRVHPDDLPAALEAIEKSHVDPEFNYKIVHRLRHKDGHWVWVLDRGETIFDTAGKAIRMIGFHTDISAQKEQEMKISNLNTLLTTTMNSIDALVFVKDKEFKYLECNRAFEEFIGHSKVELLGHDDYEFFPKEQADVFRSHDSYVLEKVEVKRDLHKVKTSDGDEIYQLATISPLIDEHGNVFGIVGTAVDITEMKNLEASVEKQKELMIAQSRQAAMGEMISMIAHQWRQPISVISMSASNMLIDIELDKFETESFREDATNIIEQTQHLSKTIDDFRDFFKPNKLKDEALVSDVMRETISVIGKSFENNQIEIKTDFEDTTKIEIFSRELLQVLLNILQNAKEALVEYKKEDRKINTKVYEDEENIIIEISDNGAGIKEEILEKIFDPYFSTKNEKNGTGLGLYMSKVIVSKHLHGTIMANNTPTGVVFVIKLPK